MKDNTIPTSTRLTTDELILINKSGFTPAQFLKEAVQEKLKEENLDFIVQLIKIKEKEIEDLKIKQNLLLKKETEKLKLSEKEIKYLLETKELLERNPSFVKGRIKQYINLFKKTYKFSETEFYELIEEAEKQKSK